MDLVDPPQHSYGFWACAGTATLAVVAVFVLPAMRRRPWWTVPASEI
jgi:hypothetical protein